jgi:hypothetical protein
VALGRELARAGWRIAVYSSDHNVIEPDVVRGYASYDGAASHSILCFSPFAASVNFAEMADPRELIRVIDDPADDWEVSFYRSIGKVDGVLVLGGGSSTLIAGHIALSAGLPVVAIAEFGGSATKLWRHLASEPGLFHEDDRESMARWQEGSAVACVASLDRQHRRRHASIADEQAALRELQANANKWVAHAAQRRTTTHSVLMAVGFIVVFLALLIAGLTLPQAGLLYTSVLMLGLCAAGALGASVRMLMPTPPASDRWTAPVLGLVVGLMLSLFYLVPQLIGAAGFLVPDSAIQPTTRVQYLSAVLVAFLTGMGFDYALEQLLRRAKERGDKIVSGSP